MARALPLLVNLSVGCLAYLLGYFATPAGRGDLGSIRRKLPGRFGGPSPEDAPG